MLKVAITTDVARPPGAHEIYPYSGYKVPRVLGRVSLDLRFRGPLEAKYFVRCLKPTLPGPGEGSSILNVDLVVVTAAVPVVFVRPCPGHRPEPSAHQRHTYRSKSGGTVSRASAVVICRF